MSKFAKKLTKMSPSQQRVFLDDPSLRAKTGQLRKLYKIMTNFDVIAAKINHDEFSVQTLIDAYDLIDNTEVLNNTEYNHQKVKRSN
jgi:hypothetical protein